MTARIVGSIRPQAQFADAEVRANHIARNKALGLRDTEGNVNARAEARLWRSPRSATSPRDHQARAPRFVMLGIGFPFSMGGGIATVAQF